MVRTPVLDVQEYKESTKNIYDSSHSRFEIRVLLLPIGRTPQTSLERPYPAYTFRRSHRDYVFDSLRVDSLTIVFDDT